MRTSSEEFHPAEDAAASPHTRFPAAEVRAPSPAPEVFLRPPLTLFSISGVFALLQAYAFLQYLKDRLTRQEFQTLFFLGVSLAAGMVFLTVIYLTYTGRTSGFLHV